MCEPTTVSKLFNKTMLKKFLGLSTLLIASASPATAATINVTEPKVITTVTNADDSTTTVRLNPLEPTHLAAASQKLLDTLAADYPSWSFINGEAATGTFYVTQYDAAFSGTNIGGGETRLTYVNEGPAPIGKKFQWIQLIDTNRPLEGTTNVYIDPRQNDDNLPFYWTNDQLSSFSTGTILQFGDFPKRENSELPVRWTAELYLVEWDGGKSVTIRDGVSHGFEIVSNTSSVNQSLARFSSIQDKGKARIVPEPSISFLTWLLLGTTAFFMPRLKLLKQP